jgi:hypothetical protein
MAITDANQMIWHKAYERALKTITSLRNHCDFKYERDSKNAKTVRVLNAVRPTIRTYVPGTSITRDAVSATKVDIDIDQFRYFNIGLDDVIKAQSVPGALEATAAEGALALSEEGDKYVASLVKAGVEASTPTIDSVARFTATKANAIEKVEEAFAILYGKNNRVSDTYWLEVAPSYFQFIRPNILELLTNNVEMAKKGVVGKYGNAMVTIENLLPKGQATTANDTVYNILRTEHAIAFIEQIDKVEAYRPEDAFEDALKGLYTFGAKVVRPDEIVVIKTAV